MANENSNMICRECQNGELIEGTLEGVSFQPLPEGKKWFSSGIYGIKAFVYSSCGNISRISLDPINLKGFKMEP